LDESDRISGVFTSGDVPLGSRDLLLKQSLILIFGKMGWFRKPTHYQCCTGACGWIAPPLTFSVAVLVSAVLSGCNHLAEREIPQLWKADDTGTLTVLVTGHEFQWHIRYPGPDGRLETNDDIHAPRHLHLPANVQVKLMLASKDYVYSLGLPHLQLKEIAVPDLSFSMEFDTDDVGVFDLLGDQMCGYTHPDLVATLTVESPSDFNAWLDRMRCQ